MRGTGLLGFYQVSHPEDVPNSIIMAINPRGLQVIDVIEAQEFIGGRLTSVQFEGKNYIYVAGFEQGFPLPLPGRITSTLDTSWGPVVLFGPCLRPDRCLGRGCDERLGRL